MLWFRNDYGTGACPQVFKKLCDINNTYFPGYSTDTCCDAMQNRVRELTGCPDARVYPIPGGTQTNMLVISTLLRPWEAVIAAQTGHINVHETGAVEATGHKVLTCPAADGKVTPEMVADILSEHTDEHMVKPAMVYISQTTEIGTCYTLRELEALSEYCREKGLYLFMDGARLASGLAESDMTFADIGRLTDVFYIGGTKCGALFGEALVLPRPGIAPEMLYSVKTRGARFAKGWLIGAQFEALLEGTCYVDIGRHENEMAKLIRKEMEERGYAFASDSRTNQQFPILTEHEVDLLAGKVEFERQQSLPDGKRVIRFVTGWSTTEQDVEGLMQVLDSVRA